MRKPAFDDNDKMIDRRFLDPTSPTARSLLQLMVHTAHTLGLTVTAEGVETEDHLALLREVECEFAQGFHLGRPMPAGDVEGFERDRDATSV